MNTRPVWFAAVGMLTWSVGAWAGPHGYDLHNTLMPASQAMAGTSHARPQDLPSAVFGNPATLTQYGGGTRFTFGATFYNPEVDLVHDGSVTGAPFKTESDTDVFPVPIIGVAQDLTGLGIPAVLGLGVTAVSGIGSSFRDEPKALGAGAEFIIFGVNAGAGFPVTDNLSLGGALTISFAQLDASLSSTAAETHALGGRLTLGATYDIGATTIGVWGQSEQEHNFQDLFQTSVDAQGFPVFSDQKVQQPFNIGLGIANSSLMGGDLLIAADFIQKFWSDATFWQDVFDDQSVFSLGVQWNPGGGNWVWRAGIGWAEDPNRDPPSGQVGDISQVVTGPGGLTVPTDPVFVVPYLQATQTEVIYEWRIGLGFGYQNFLTPGLNLDVGMGWEFEEDRDFGTGSLPGGGHTNSEVYSYHFGIALTWNFTN